MIVPLPRYHTRHPSRAQATFHLLQIFVKSFPCFQLLSRNLAKTLQVLVRDISFPCGDRATSYAQEKLRTGGGVCKDLSCQKTCVGDGGELDRELDDMYAKCDLRKRTLQKSLKFSDCRKSIRKGIRPSCRKPSDFFLCLFGFGKGGNLEIQANFRIALKCLGKELPPLSNYYKNK